MLAILGLAAAGTAAGQTLDAPTRPMSAAPTTNQGHTASLPVGEIGRRQTRDQAAKGITPMTRIANRIESRVKSRINSRIDRNHNPQFDVISPIEEASDQARSVALARDSDKTGTPSQ